MKRNQRLAISAVVIVVVLGMAWVVLRRQTGRMIPSQTSRVQQVSQDRKSPAANHPTERAPVRLLNSSPFVDNNDSTGAVPRDDLLVEQLIQRGIASPASDEHRTGVTMTGEKKLFTENVPATKHDSMVIAVALSEYHRLFGAYPTGNNVALSKALAGENPKKIVLLAFKHIGKGGEMLDPWGNPYDIQVTEDGRLRIHSAGSNLTMGDADDILLEHPLAMGRPYRRASGSPIKE